MTIADGDFRRYLYPPDHPRVRELVGLDADGYAEHAKGGDFTGGLIRGWQQLYPASFRGVTTDGVVRTGLCGAGPARPGEEAPTAAMVAAAFEVLDHLDSDHRTRFRYAVDAVEWQSWANPEFLQHDTGLRLERLDQAARERLLALVRTSLSPEGFRLVRTLMRINAFLGREVGLPAILNEYSYNMALYGEPSLTGPWGWQLFGHHVALNVLVLGTRMVATPVFLGAEPDHLETSGAIGRPVFADRIAHARALMAALTPEQQDRAVAYEHMVDPAMPPGRIHPGDERHLAGAFQDNRVIPVEGVPVADLGGGALTALDALAADFTAYLPSGPAAARRREIREWYSETTVSWIGGRGPEDVFYVRVQSPVVVLELDHHTGVFLTNDEPAPFHVHTVMRTPNGNDYGRALVLAERSR